MFQLSISSSVELYGSGIGEIINSFKSNGLLEPDFKEEFGGFSLYMFKGHTEQFLRKIGLNNRQIQAMNYLYKEGYITTLKYSTIIPEVSEGTLKRDLSDMVKKGLIKKVGPRKLRRYELIKK
jgi:Predicted transcriptional regulator containing an HTH domain and an uncharacterized domain shared with the mammalian protein Schlafen